MESGKKASERIRRPVLFGSNGHAEVSYEIDAFHDGDGIVVEVEAGWRLYEEQAIRPLA